MTKYVGLMIWHNYEFGHCDNILGLQEDKPTGERFRWIVPDMLISMVVRATHCPNAYGHLGITKTTEDVVSRFYWPRLQEDVMTLLQGCTACLKARVTKPKAQTPLGRSRLEHVPRLKTWSMDFVEMGAGTRKYPWSIEEIYSSSSSGKGPNTRPMDTITPLCPFYSPDVRFHRKSAP